MNRQNYMYIKDSNNNVNIWSIVEELEDKYVVHSRETISEISKAKCFYKDGYSLLWTNEIRDIDESNIEIESEVEYEEWLELQESQEENINPFRIYDEIDMGYLEPDSYGEDLLYLCEFEDNEYLDEDI